MCPLMEMRHPSTVAEWSREAGQTVTQRGKPNMVMLWSIGIAERVLCNPISNLAEFEDGLLSSVSLREEVTIK